MAEPRSLGGIRSLAEWLAWQETLHPRSIDLGLERVRAVASKLDVPDFTCPVVTVGGTNGKGSCVALLEALLTAGGYRVGAFTSPHLVRYNERIRIAGRLASDAELVAAFERIDAARGAISLTFFEFNTLAALLLFKAEPLDAVILEVGLGGRLDAVNVIDADVALLTTVGLDHCDWLGPTVADIGREKAGIFRAGRPAVLGSTGMPQSVFEVARSVEAKLSIPGVDYHFEIRPNGWDWRTLRDVMPAKAGIQSTALDSRLRGNDDWRELPLPALAGGQQSANAAAVLAVLHELRTRLPLSREQIVRGLQAVKLHGRFQVVPGEVEWILDVAHNPQAAVALADTLAGRPCKGKTIAVVGILRDKDAPAVVAPLLPKVDVWIAATIPEPRGESAAELIGRCGAPAAAWLRADSVEEACERALGVAKPGDRIVVFGSFHTVGPALHWLEADRLSPLR